MLLIFDEGKNSWRPLKAFLGQTVDFLVATSQRKKSELRVWLSGNELRKRRNTFPISLWRREDPMLPWRGLSLIAVARKKMALI